MEKPQKFKVHKHSKRSQILSHVGLIAAEFWASQDSLSPKLDLLLVLELIHDSVSS